MTLTDKLTNIGRMYAAVTEKSYHYWRPASVNAPFLVWQEDSGIEFVSGNRVAEQAVRGTTDFFTKEEFDSTFDAIQTAQNSLPGFVWSLDAVIYEDDTNLIHYSWSWSYTG